MEIVRFFRVRQKERDGLCGGFPVSESGVFLLWERFVFFSFLQHCAFLYEKSAAICFFSLENAV
jgi:hypothetical protein